MHPGMHPGMHAAYAAGVYGTGQAGGTVGYQAPKEEEPVPVENCPKLKRGYGFPAGFYIPGAGEVDTNHDGVISSEELGVASDKKAEASGMKVKKSKGKTNVNSYQNPMMQNPPPYGHMGDPMMASGALGWGVSGGKYGGGAMYGTYHGSGHGFHYGGVAGHGMGYGGMAAMDKDGDGVVTAAEISEHIYGPEEPVAQPMSPKRPPVKVDKKATAARNAAAVEKHMDRMAPVFNQPAF